MAKINWKDKDAILQEKKDAKINSFKELCTEDIYKGFMSSLTNKDGVNYSFGFNSHDQQNFDQQYLLIVSGDNAGQTVYWKDKNLGVVALTEDEFKIVVREAKEHKLLIQNKYWQLEREIMNATTIEELENISW